MFAGKKTNVTLEGRNEIVGVMIDRFGKDIIIIPIDKDHFRTTVSVALSKQFLGWIISLGDGIRIVGPDMVVGKMKEEIRRLMDQYTVH